jgi:hypothetical protein
MKNRTFFILISFIAILLLTACTSSPTQSVVSAPTPILNSVLEQSTADSASTQSSTTDSASTQSNSVSTQSNSVSNQSSSTSISSTSTQDSTSINVHTLPGAVIHIKLTYCGQSFNDDTKYADSRGNYTLNWTPKTKCGGIATAEVTTSSNGQSSTNSTSFSVS